MSLKYNKNNIRNAIFLRKNVTVQERDLWFGFLRTYRPKFQRQKAIDNFIADFYCHKAHLIIELDGAQHLSEQGMEKDGIRTFILESYGLKVLRIPNRCIDNDFKFVCNFIDQTVKEMLANVK